MRGSDLKNDWDSFEELHVAVEQLELCQRLLRTRSHSKARAAVILLDHVADALMYRICSYDFGHEEFLEMVIPPAVPKEKREKILYRFEEKLSYTAQIKKLISGDESTVLTIAHRVRNFAYHRNYHNPSTIGIVGRILFKTVCGILPNFCASSSSSAVAYAGADDLAKPITLEINNPRPINAITKRTTCGQPTTIGIFTGYALPFWLQSVPNLHKTLTPLYTNDSAA